MTLYRRILSKVSRKVNEWTGGLEGYSVCGQIYLNSVTRKGRLNKIVVKIIDSLFFLEENHCRNAWVRSAARHEATRGNKK